MASGVMLRIKYRLPSGILPRKELEKIKPVFMLAEAESSDLQEHAFDMTYAWEFHNILKEIYKGKMTC